MEKEKITILVWFSVFDEMARDSESEDIEEKVQELFDSADLVYAQAESYQSACERIYSSKVHKLPNYVNNDDSVEAYAKERENKKLKIIYPMKVLEELTGKNADEISEDIQNQMHGPSPFNVKDMSKEDMEKQLPKGIANAFRGLTDAIEQTNEKAQEIIGEYMSACNISGIDEKQAQDEGQTYMKSEGNIPAAEFVCPVDMLDKLKSL